MVADKLALFVAWTSLPPEYANALVDWEFHAYERGGEVQAIAALDGTEIHFAIAPDWRHKVIARRRTQEFLAPLMERRGFLTTRAEPIETNHRFLSRLGFEKTWNDGQFDHYILIELPFGNSEAAKCYQHDAASGQATKGPFHG